MFVEDIYELLPRNFPKDGGISFPRPSKSILMAQANNMVEALVCPHTKAHFSLHLLPYF